MKAPFQYLSAIIFAVLFCAALCAVAAALLYALLVTGLHSTWQGWAINIGLLWPFFVAGLWWFRAQPALDMRKHQNDDTEDPLVWAWRTVVGANKR